jgi:hypothetical protein
MARVSTDVPIASMLIAAAVLVVVTAALSIAFHHELARGATPQDALRNVQVQFIRRGMPIASWAAFQVSS